MNAGARLDEVIHTVTPPPALMERPYLQPVYDEPEFIVRTIWRLYGGWWDGNPATLKPAAERALALELAELAGGATVLADRALALMEGAGSGAFGQQRGHADDSLRLAGHLAELAWLAAPQDPAIAKRIARCSPGVPTQPHPPWPRGCFRGRRGPRRRTSGGGPLGPPTARVATPVNRGSARTRQPGSQLLLSLPCPLVSSP